MRIDDFLTDLEFKIDQLVTMDELKRVPASEGGLDDRAGYVYCSDDYVIVRGETRPIEYYGGFEYVDRRCVSTVGRYTFYKRGDSRVDEFLDRVAGNYVEEYADD